MLQLAFTHIQIALKQYWMLIWSGFSINLGVQGLDLKTDIRCMCVKCATDNWNRTLWLIIYLEWLKIRAWKPKLKV